MKPKGRQRSSAVAVVLLLGLCVISAVTTATSAAPGGGSTFSGRAVGLKATILGIDTVIADTGPLPSSGGSLEASLLKADVAGLATAEAFHSATVGQGDQSRSEASLANLNLSVGGNNFAAGFLMARAAAQCAPGGPTASGSSEIVALVINGQATIVSGSPNQTIALPNGQVVINEQSGSANAHSSELTVNALHVIVDGVADVVVASAHADITCQGAPICTGAPAISLQVAGGSPASLLERRPTLAWPVESRTADSGAT